MPHFDKIRAGSRHGINNPKHLSKNTNAHRYFERNEFLININAPLGQKHIYKYTHMVWLLGFTTNTTKYREKGETKRGGKESKKRGKRINMWGLAPTVGAHYQPEKM